MSIFISELKLLLRHHCASLQCGSGLEWIWTESGQGTRTARTKTKMGRRNAKGVLFWNAVGYKMQRVSHSEIVRTENQATRTKCERCARFKYGMHKKPKQWSRNVKGVLFSNTLRNKIKIMTQKWKSGVIFNHIKHNINPETQISKNIEMQRQVFVLFWSTVAYRFKKTISITDELFWAARVHKEDYPISQNVAWKRSIEGWVLMRSVRV